MKYWKITLLTLTLIFTTSFSSIGQPPVPVLSAATNIDCSSFMANWNASAGATAYYLEVSTSTTFGTFVGVYSPVSCGTNLTWFVSGLTPNTTYYYRVSASNGSGSSGYTTGTYITVKTLTAAGCSSNLTWTQVGSAPNGGGVTTPDTAAGMADFEVAALANDCKDNLLFAGGYFTTVNFLSIPASCVAKWTPSAVYPYTAGTWSNIGNIGGGLAVSYSGVPQNPHEIYAMVYYNGIVYVGGNFTTINGSTTDGSGKTYNNLAQYNVSTGIWSAVGGSGGITGGSGTGLAVYYAQGPVSGNVGGFYVQSLAVDMSGHLYVGGNFTKVAGASTDGAGKSFNNIAMWNGTTWSALNGGMTGTNSNGAGTAVPTVYSLDVVDSVHVYAGGQFKTAGGTGASNIAVWNGASWSALGAGIPQNAMGPNLCGGLVSGTVNWSDCPAVLALANVGTLVYAAGVFNKAGAVSADNIAQWNQGSSTWKNIGGLGGPTNDIGEAVAECVNNGILYVGGDFQNANNCALTVNNVAGYDGSNWILMPASAPGFQPGLSNVLSFTALTGFPTPGYSILYCGGDFEGGTNAPSAPAVNHIAQYAGLPGPSNFLTVTPSSSICSGSNVTLTAGGASSYTWSPGTGLNVTTGSTVIATPTVTTTYTVTGTDPGGCACACTQTATVVITVGGGLTITASAAPASICSGGSTTLTGSGAGVGGTYTWSPSTGLAVTTGASVTATPTTTVTYTVTGSNGGCNGTATVVVTVGSAATLTVTAVPPSICKGDSTILTASGATTYTWSASTGLNKTTGASVDASPGSATTYTVTGTTGGCIGTGTISVTVNPTPTVSVTLTGIAAAICSGDTIGLIAKGASTYTWSPATGLSATTGSYVIASPGTSTTYTVTGSNGGGCVATATVAVAVYPTPTINITSSATSICPGDSVTLNASGATTYKWSPPGGLSCTICSSTVASPGSTTTYTVSGKGTGGCIAKDSIVITVSPPPSITLTPGINSAICSGSTNTITASGASNYTWAPSSSVSSTSGSVVTVNPSVTTTYTVIGSNGSSCKDTAHIVISVTPTPTISILPSAPGICAGDTVALSASGASSYLWSPPGGLSCTSCSNPSANPGSTITYTVVGTIGSCTAKDSVTINVGTLTVTATPSNPGVCSGTPTTITASGAVNYTWSPSAGLNTTTGTVVQADPSGTTTYTLIGSSGKGCADTITVVVKVTASPTLTVAKDTVRICSGGSIIISASGASTYTWSPPGGLSCTSCDSTTANPGSTTIYTVTGTNAGGCSSKDSVTVIIDKPVVIPTASSPTVCAGSSTILSATGAANYTWSPPGGLSCTSCDSTTANPGSTTFYTVIGTDTVGCSDATTLTVTVNPTPTVSVSANDTTICSGSSASLTASGATTYLWSPPGGLSCTSCNNTTANPGSTTTYTIVGSNGACKDTTTFTVIVNSTPTVSIGVSSDTICKGSSTTLTANGTAGNYVWSTGATTSTINVSPGSQTSYTVTAGNGTCTATATTTVTLYPPLTVTMVNDSECLGKTGTVGVIVSGGEPTYNYSWSSNITGSGPGPFSVTPTSPPSWYVCSVTDQCAGTPIKDSEQVVIRPSPQVSFTTTPDTVPGGQYVVFVNTSTNASSYYWSFGDGGTSVSDSTALHQYNNSGDYVVYLVGSTAGGCADTAWDTVYVTSGIYIPNVFTPNGDGQNDVFHITASGLENYTLEIFNRWGQRVFTADSPNIDWTGRSESGVEESDGTYYYIIKATGFGKKQYKFQGYLELIR